MGVDTSDPLNVLWLIYRGAVAAHIAVEKPVPADTEAKYRERAEKAGLVAVVNFTKKAYGL